MWRRKRSTSLEGMLPKGSWVNQHPNLGRRGDLSDLFIEVDQLEASLPGILGLDDRRLAVTKNLVDDQFAEVGLELAKFSEDVELDAVREYVSALKAAYDQYIAEREIEN